MGDKWKKGVVRKRSTYFNMKQSRFKTKYGWINGRNEVGRRRKQNRSRVRSVWSE